MRRFSIDAQFAVEAASKGAKGESSGVLSDNRFNHWDKHIVTTELAIAISHQDIGGT